MTEIPVSREEIRRLRATIDITHTLLAAVSSTDPVRSLASRMSVLCQGTAVIYDFEGNVVASAGEAPTQLIWNEVAATNQPELQVEIGRWFVRTRRVALRGGVHVIGIASRGADTIEQIGSPLLDIAEQMLGAVHGIRYGASQRDRRDNEQLIASLHDGILPSREHRFWNRLAQFQFLAYAPVRAIEFAPIDASSASEQEVTQLAASARSAEVPLLIMLRRTDMDAPATIAAILPDSTRADRWLEAAARTFLVGASAPFSALSQVPTEVREAEVSLGIARRLFSPELGPELIGPIRLDRIDLATWLLSHVNSKELQARVERTLEPLTDESLRHTLVNYLVFDQNVTRTAEALFVHPNTVRYRLSRVEEALGVPIASARTLANLALALNTELAAAHFRREAEERSAAGGELRFSG